MFSLKFYCVINLATCSISVGSVANCYPPKSSDRALLLADIRCLPGEGVSMFCYLCIFYASPNYGLTSNLPGMEGGPVFGVQNTLVGILIRPLRQKNSDSEIQVTCKYFSYSYSFKISHS